MVSLKLENAELRHIGKIVAISKAAFDSDVTIGVSETGGPPEYDSVTWHEEMLNKGHLFQAIEAGEIVGGAILFLENNGEFLFVGRIFVDPISHRKGYGIALMTLIEKHYPNVKQIMLDTPLWNVRTNAFYKKLGYCEVKRDEEFAYYQKVLIK